MACKNCESRDIRVTNKGMFTNEYVCRKCKHEGMLTGSGMKRIGIAAIIFAITVLVSIS